MVDIGVVISYCSRDYKWLKPCIENIKGFAKEIKIPVSDHFFNGEKEDMKLIHKSITENPDAEFIEFEYDPKQYEGLNLKRLNDPFSVPQYMVDIDPTEIWFWNQLARAIGWEKMSSEYILFLDVDEICDQNRFIQWLNSFSVKDFNSIRFDSYFYFLKTSFQSLTWEDWNAITLVKNDALTVDTFFKHSSERLNFINFVNGNRKVKTEGLDGKPLFHHYSWVRSKEEMLSKVKSWSHHQDRNWTELVENEFKREFIPGKDKCFVHNYDYVKVNPYIKI